MEKTRVPAARASTDNQKEITIDPDELSFELSSNSC